MRKKDTKYSQDAITLTNWVIAWDMREKTMTEPKRITRIPRQKIHENALFIGTRSPFANHFKVKENKGGFFTIENKKLNWGGMVIHQSKEGAQKAAIQLFSFYIHQKYKTEEEIKEFLEPIKGKDLCDWCKQDAQCHLDYLIYLANRG